MITKAPDQILWFFSTCAQTFATLVSVFGMFVLYRLQIEEGRIGALMERMIGYDERHLKLPFEIIIQQLHTLEQEHIGRQEHDQAKNIRSLLEDYRGATRKRAWLSRQARRPVIALVILTFWSLTGIVAYPYFSTSVLGVVLMWLTLAACLLPLYQVALIISVSLSLD